MQHETQVRVISELLRQLEVDRNIDAGRQLRVPASAYTCQDLAAEEWQAFFRSRPQVIGLSGDLPGPGSFVTVDDFGVNVLATRAEDGKFRAFVNACRHRGVQVAQEPHGDATRFQCPFHHWTYSNRGELLGVPRTKDFGDIDRACHSLIPLPAEEFAGLLWVHPQADATLDVQAELGELGPELQSWGMDKLELGGRNMIDKALNWKLANDTFGETYHFKRLHPETLGRLLIGDATSHEVFGRHHRFAFPFRTIGEMRDKPESEWRIGRAVSVFYYLFPNVQMNVGPRHVTLVRIYPHPEGPGRSVSRISHYFRPTPADFVADPDRQVLDANNVYDTTLRKGRVQLSPAASMEVFDSTVEQEDYVMGESIQAVAESGSMPEFIFGRNEAPLHHFHNTFRRELGLPPLEVVREGGSTTAR